jgi:RHS repeat-associated protein
MTHIVASLREATYERKQILDYTLGDPTIDLYSGFSVLDDKLSLSEWPIYGSARLGVLDLNGKGELYNNGTAMWTKSLSHTKAGCREYEITNHLGNVLATISDVKQGIDDPVDGTIDYYNPSVLTSQDYYPFGMPMPGRTFKSDRYRFGFNGMEKDDEVKGKGNSLDFGARIYDSRLGRWLSTDPLEKQFPSESPYSFAGNNPIYYIDKDGKKKITYITTIINGTKTTHQVVKKDIVMKQREYYLPDEGAHLFTIDWNYNVVEFITLDFDNNKAYTTGELPTDKAWDDDYGLAFLDDLGSTKQSGQAGGNSLMAKGFPLPGNTSRYEPTAQNPGKDIDVGDLLGGRGGASLPKKYAKAAMAVEVLKTGFDLGQSLGEIVNNVKKNASSSTYCKACAAGGDSNANFERKEDGTLSRIKSNLPAKDTADSH